MKKGKITSAIKLSINDGYNNNLVGDKRRKRNITKYGGMSLANRVKAEGLALTAYQKRVGQYKPSEK